MKIHFLCPRHRQWLERHPHIARDLACTGYDTAVLLLATGNDRDAALHAGCALKAADIVMAAAQPATPSFTRHYARTGALLFEVLQCLGRRAEAREVVQGCLARLAALLQRGAERTTVQQACNVLLRVGGPEPAIAAATPCARSGSHGAQPAPAAHTLH